MRLAVALAMGVALASCAQAQQAKPAGPRTATPASTAPTAEVSRSPVPPGPYLALLRGSTVALVTLQGQVVASQSFTPVPAPRLTNAAAVTPPPAQAVSARVWFMDAAGVLRTLSPDGSVREAVRVPIPAGPFEASFAISPDAQRVMVMATAVQPSGTGSMQAYTASVGGPATKAYHRDFTAADDVGSGEQLFGWDSIGPLATFPSSLGTQGGGPHHYNGSRVVHVQADGSPGPPLTDPTACVVEDVLLDGWFVCGNPRTGTLEVHAADGSTAWTYGRPGEFLSYAFLSPDHNHLVAAGNQDEVITKNGPVTVLPAGFFHAGWVNPRTVAGNISSVSGNEVAIVNLDHPGQFDDLHVAGDFIGGVSDSP